MHIFGDDRRASPLTKAPARHAAPHTLRDLFETLAIDHEDVLHLADGFDARTLPRRRLWRQDDNGNAIEVATFTGVRKAEAALRRLEALKHKQMYWLEALPPIG